MDVGDLVGIFAFCQSQKRSQEIYTSFVAKNPEVQGGGGRVL